jgi:hypothetical protein
MMTRYSDAYQIANATVAIGETVKTVSFGAGLLLGVAGIYAATSLSGWMWCVVGILVGLVVGGGGFVLGTLLSALGQVLKATLDTAVNSSPFLENDQRAEIMSLS